MMMTVVGWWLKKDERTKGIPDHVGNRSYFLSINAAFWNNSCGSL